MVQYHDVHLGTYGINQFVNCLISVFGAPIVCELSNKCFWCSNFNLRHMFSDKFMLALIIFPMESLVIIFLMKVMWKSRPFYLGKLGPTKLLNGRDGFHPSFRKRLVPF
jgi:hypothetical protein